MKVLFVSWRDLANDNAGGSEIVVDHLIRGLRDRGHDAELVCGGPVAPRPYPVTQIGGQYSQYAIAPFAAHRVRDVDLLVDVANGMSYFAPLWWRGPRLLYVHHVQGDMWHDYYFPTPIAAFGQFLEEKVSPVVYRGTDVVAVSPSTRGVLLDLGFARERIHLVLSGVDAHLFAPPAPKTDEPQFLAMGRLAPHKGIDRLLAIWDEVRPVVGGRLVVAGSGPEKDRLRGMHLDGVELTGWVSEERKRELLGSSWLLVHAAAQEGWGLVVSEAAACGTPTLAFATLGLQDSVVDGETGVLVADDAAFAKEWIALAQDPARRAAMGSRAQERAGSLTWEATVDQFLDAATAAIERHDTHRARAVGSSRSRRSGPSREQTVAGASGDGSTEPAASATGPVDTGPIPPATMPSGLRRSIELFTLFRREPVAPTPFYRFLAADTVVTLQRYAELDGAVSIDIGGGSGYMADALRAEGASCWVIEYDHAEMHLHGRAPHGALRGDAQQLPVRSGSIDLAHCSNVLEHVPRPIELLDEMARVLRPGTGIGYLAFPNWLSPWGGHETSPWHYLGGERALRRYVRRHGEPPKNVYGSSMYAVSIHEVKAWFRSRPDIEILWTGPRYYPAWARGIASVPAARELLTWNLLTVFRTTS